MRMGRFGSGGRESIWSKLRVFWTLSCKSATIPIGHDQLVVSATMQSGKDHRVVIVETREDLRQARGEGDAKMVRRTIGCFSTFMVTI